MSHESHYKSYTLNVLRCYLKSPWLGGRVEAIVGLIQWTHLFHCRLLKVTLCRRAVNNGAIITHVTRIHRANKETTFECDWPTMTQTMRQDKLLTSQRESTECCMHDEVECCVGWLVAGYLKRRPTFRCRHLNCKSVDARPACVCISQSRFLSEIA